MEATNERMIPDSSNINFQLAYNFVNNTNCSLYLTGKAGTGKTTFLKYVKNNCSKNLVIVAPTGVAAINAGGVTMHSFFQLPFGPYLPDVKTGFGMNEGVVDKNALFKNLKLNSTKRKLIAELQLLIIDEVSMLRSDTLDSIDTILKVFRKSYKPFGGVQVLFIGDLYQLPPVVKDSEKELLDRYYNSPFFFDAKVLEQTPLVYIELKKIYRQNEQSFIDLLNKLRHNQLEEEDFRLLNKRYDPGFAGKDKNYITLTTHNHKADVINTEELKKLPSKLHTFKGALKGDFGDKQLPTELMLQLKEGAQVMFVKNDSSPEKKYYNGKIVVISKIQEDEIYVTFPEAGDEYLVKQESWENINYTLNKDTNGIDEKVVGEFIQYPLRLAWAITIHKSQGLTFEKAIIDAGSSFAPGQVYVALSRCTSLDGVVLHSRITEHALHTEDRIARFTMNESNENILLQQLQHEQFKYQTERMIAMFQWQRVLDAIYELEEATLLNQHIPVELNANELMKTLVHKTREHKQVADKFIYQLDSILNEIAFSRDTSKLKERVRKGIGYFVNALYNDIFLPLSDYLKKINGKSKLKKYVLHVAAIYNSCWLKLDELQESTYDDELLFDATLKVSKHPVEVKVIKLKKGDSPKESLAYFVAGKSIEEIAEIRGLVVSTIEKHLSEFVKTGELEIARFLSLEQLHKIKQAYLGSDDKSSKVIKEMLHDEFSFNQLRMAMYHLKNTQEI